MTGAQSGGGGGWKAARPGTEAGASETAAGAAEELIQVKAADGGGEGPSCLGGAALG